MAITDYSSLQSEIADWSHRSDLSTKIPTFIQLAESKMSTKIRDRKLEVTLNDSIAAGGNSVADLTGEPNFSCEDTKGSVCLTTSIISAKYACLQRLTITRAKDTWSSSCINSLAHKLLPNMKPNSNKLNFSFLVPFVKYRKIILVIHYLIAKMF